MEALSEAKGKGVLMFAQRRKRIDEIASEHEELRSKGLPVEELTEAECREAHTTYDKEKCVCNEASYAAASLKQPIEYQKNKMNHLSNVPRPLVPNRTAKPFLRFQNGTTAPVTPSAVSPVTKKNEPRFKVPAPAPINTSRQVWSPTGDIIASRDERICVPAIKAGILPEPKRKFISKKQSMLVRESDPHLQSKGEQKSYIESEEDCFSLGAEASNFMQPRTIKLKNPPPVPPKPTINPNCPPWRSLSSEPYIPVRSPISQPSYSSVGPHSQHYLQKQDRAQSQHMPRCSASDQTQAKFQPPTNAWAPVKSSSRLHLQPATNSWSQQPLQSPGFGRSRSLSLPRRLNSMPSPRLLSPVSTPGTQSLFLPMQRQTSFQEKVYKPPTPWEAASRSPIGSVDEAFVSQSLPSSVASNIKAAGLLKSLPEPPDELKCRVSLDPAAVSKGHYEAPSTSRTFSPEKPAFYGPPFKPAQPLWPAARATIGYMGQGSCPTVYSPLCSTVQRS